ncbi:MULTISPECIES: hypothetical protein [Reichenbachiella]|uniref:Membrane-bound lysozyme-inhibitor of c-type lysozyme n=1 Tax=Reichenbachiella agariperforans TaxID=156994 RepID=A0A1M6WZP2_REIAG|nr:MULTISPECIES: hypothetical protein [Reichenbachiella]RJE74977.1 hypothetical protein BGP76_17820 [Reichenbachiella sp. MSK19-1]SHK99133.1 hypothetical protein SAMN04488028_1211 [Reichenbachiella agariperforans]
MKFGIKNMLFYFLLFSIHAVCYSCVSKSSLCEETSRAINEKIDGVVIDASLNEFNHAKIMLYSNGYDTLSSWLFVNERSHVFSQLQAGDSILKRKGSLDFYWIRDGNKSYERLDYGCNDHVKKRVVN